MKNSSSFSIPITNATANSTKAVLPKRAPAPKKVVKSKKVEKPVVAIAKPAKLEKKSSKTNATKKASLDISKQPIIKRNPLGHLLIEKMFREAGFRGGISSDKKILDKYSTDESIFSIRPQVVIQPKNRKDVEIAVEVIARETKRFSSLSLTPRAAGTGLSGGSLTDSIVLDVCAHLHMIGEVVEKKDEITITCEPGAMWRNVEKKLKHHKAYIPSYPASKDICSIGGAIGNNSAGPDSLHYGHCAEWVESMDVVLNDGKTYTIKALTLKEYKTLIKGKNEHARIAKEIFSLIEKNESEIKKNTPKTKKNTAGYSLWHVFSEGVADFKKGKGVFDLTRLFSGSQGTIGVITHLTMRAIPIPKNTQLIVVPIFDLDHAAEIILEALEYNPINLEIFDSLTYKLALDNPEFFKDRLQLTHYYRVMFSMYVNYHVRYARKVPEFTILMTIDEKTANKTNPKEIAKKIGGKHTKARVITNKYEAEMYWQIRRASYTLSKFQDKTKRPAAFLEDMTVPPKNLSKFFIQVRRLLKEFNITAAVHGHGGDGHFHFYPLLDFTNKTTPALVEKMAEKFFDTAIKFDGEFCGEHNDGIIRTPFLNKTFTKKMLEIFVQTEHIFDTDDIFNPGKKVNPRFDIKTTMRKTN